MVALPFMVILAELVLFSSQISSAVDIINQFQPLVDGDSNTLVSENGTFELGFFTPGSSTNRYVGIWYKIIPKRTVVWVANRDNPIKDNASNMLIINKDNGNLVLLSNNHTLWSTNLTTNHVTPIVKLLDNGNLVLRNENDTVTEIFLWQSFDYPTDTLLPGMKLGRNLKTGFNRIITAWKNWDDPSSGNFSLGIVLDSTASIPAMVMWNGLAIYWSGGPWIGSRFGGGPDIYAPIYSHQFVNNGDEVFYSYEVTDKSMIVTYVMNQTINSRKLTRWDRRNGYLINKSLVPKDHCDRYNLCGPNGNCVLGQSPMCQCLKGFEPKSSEDWDLMNFTQGCVRSKPWSCKVKDKDGFRVFAMMKFPYTTHSWVDRNMTIKDCKAKCLENCSCTAYSSLDERDDSGCSIWFGDLIDLRLTFKTGPYLYVRMAVSDKGEVTVDHCDRYNLCGAHGNCVFGQSPICQCLHGFEPKSSQDWDAMNWTQGCVRSKPWSCKVKDKDGFREFTMMKFPDTTHSWVDRNMTLEDCKAKCFENCSCTAYSSLDVKDGSGCSIWFGDLIDLRLASENGQVLYVRMAVSDKGKDPMDHCDPYNLCGPHGNCVLGQSPICKCLRGFEPKSSLDWDAMNWTHGCVRSEPWSCKVKDNDGFHVFSMMKFPDTTYSWVDRNMTLEDCKAKCFENCSCTAYSSLDVTDGSGCSIWFGDLIDLRLASENGQDLYVRMAISNKAANDKKARNGVGRKKKAALVITITLPLALLLLFGFFYIYRSKTKCRETKDEADHEDLELPFYDLATIAKATNNFSIDNKLGEGGFGPVYKGTLEDGKEVAVKRLSRNSRQGLQEFKNEVMLCAKLQHRNLVKVLGCCIDGEETMLLYEYMPNKSLDTFLFDSTQCKLLDWSKRFHILCAIARGMLYLHQDSRLRIIHRDLKASNILLDNDMNPKISDFGLAKMCGDDQTEGSTSRLVGTFGYMAPEYINEGLFSIKSDVFSFGVLLLEIVSGKKTRHPNQNCNLVEHAWRLWNECIPKDFIDECLQNSCILSEALRCIHVGLLCVQHHPDDRPTMSSVLVMLSSESILPQPREPGFLIEKVSPEGCSSEKQTSSINNVSQYYTHDNCFTS